jgi:outer membrane protein W
MRKVFILFAICSLGNLSVSAQIKKGTRIIGASIGNVVVNSGTADVTVDQIGNSTSKITGYNISINPSIGWFISDNTAVGASFNINPVSNKNTYEENGSTFQSDKSSNFNFGLGGFVRHYLKNTGNLLPFGQLGLNAGISNLNTEGFFYGGTGPTVYKTSYDGSSNGGFFFNSTFQAGVTKMLNDHTGLDFYVGYNFSYNKNEFKKTTLRDDGNDGSIDSRGENNTTTKFTNHGFVVGVGFQIFLQKKDKK